MSQDLTSLHDERLPFVNPRALTTLATAVSLVYALHQPVRWIMRVADRVDAIDARVAALEGALAHERETRAAEPPPPPADSARPRRAAR
jgi:uncharacterized membrane protein